MVHTSESKECVTNMNLNIVQCLYVKNVLLVYNCIHEKAINPSCILRQVPLGVCLKLLL